MPADPFAPEELKDDPRSQPRDPKKPKIGKYNVTLHGGITVHYSHGWLLDQEFVLMYSVIQEVCHRLHGMQDLITKYIMSYAYADCSKYACHDQGHHSLLPWLPPYVTHEARLNGVLIKRYFMGTPTGIWVVFGGRALLDGYLMVYETFIFI